MGFVLGNFAQTVRLQWVGAKSAVKFRHRPCPTFDFFNEEAIGGLVQGDAASDSFRASAGSCASANRSNRTSAAAISCLSALSHPACRRNWRGLWSCCVRRERLRCSAIVLSPRSLSPTLKPLAAHDAFTSEFGGGVSPGTTHVNLVFPCRTAWRRQKHGISAECQPAAHVGAAGDSSDAGAAGARLSADEPSHSGCASIPRRRRQKGLASAHNVAARHRAGTACGRT